MPLFCNKSQVESYCQSKSLYVTHRTVCETNGEQRMVSGIHGMFAHYYVCGEFKVYKVYCKIGFKYNLLCYQLLAPVPTANDSVFIKNQHLEIKERFAPYL